MSRNKLYEERFEVCMTKDHRKILKEMAKKKNKTMNEVLREAIELLWEKI